MKGKVKRTIKEASKLHGSTAGFVSLVDAGANETPFTLIKAKNGARTMAIKKRKAPVAKSHKAVNRKNKSTADTKLITEMAKMVFDGDHFEDEEAVELHIKAAEWDTEAGIVITENEDGDFEARPTGMTDDDYTKLGKVESEEEGVSYYVGEREVEIKSEADDEEEDEDDLEDEEEIEIETKSEDGDGDDDEEDDEDEEDGAVAKMDGKKKSYVKTAKTNKSPVTLSKRAAFLAKRKEARASSKKFDAWDAMFSEANTLAKTIADGMDWDGVPPGVAEVQIAFTTTIGNILGSDGMPAADKQEALNKASADFAEIVGGLDTFFGNYVDGDEEEIAKAFDTEEKREAISKWADDFADFVAAEEASPPKKVAKAAKSNDTGTATIDYKQVTDTVAELVKKALEPVMSTVSEVQESVEAIATRHPTKKAAAPEDGGNAVHEKSSKSKDAGDKSNERWAKGIFG